MTIPGYDPADLDDALEENLRERDVVDLLDADQRRRYEDGESLVDILDDEEIRRVLNAHVETDTGGDPPGDVDPGDG